MCSTIMWVVIALLMWAGGFGWGRRTAPVKVVQSPPEIITHTDLSCPAALTEAKQQLGVCRSAFKDLGDVNDRMYKTTKRCLDELRHSKAPNTGAYRSRPHRWTVVLEGEKLLDIDCDTDTVVAH